MQASLVAVGQSLVALHDWTFLLGPGFVVGIGNGLILGYLMYTSTRSTGHGHAGTHRRPCAPRPFRGHPVRGLRARLRVGEPHGRPEFLWELSLGIWLTVRGFNPSVIASEKFRLRPAHA